MVLLQGSQGDPGEKGDPGQEGARVRTYFVLTYFHFAATENK